MSDTGSPPMWSRPSTTNGTTSSIGINRAPSRPRGDEAVADVGQVEAPHDRFVDALKRCAEDDRTERGQVEAARAVAATALEEFLNMRAMYPALWSLFAAEILGRLAVLAPEQTYAAIQATREGLS